MRGGDSEIRLSHHTLEIKRGIGSHLKDRGVSLDTHEELQDRRNRKQFKRPGMKIVKKNSIEVSVHDSASRREFTKIRI